MISDDAIRTQLLTIAAVGALLGACAHEPGPIAVKARQEYKAAAEDPEVQRLAGVELHEAQQAVESLERADRRGEDEVELKHMGYLAQRRIEIARIAAEGAELEARTKSLGEERTRMQLEARKREVREAEERAEAAEAEVDAAQDEAQLMELDVAAARADAAEERAASAEKQLEELRNLNARQTDRGLVLTLTSGLFAVDRAELQPGASAELDRIHAYLSSHEDRSVTIEGHTDSQGTDAYNLDLSRRRAQAVADHLIGRGIPTTRIRVEGLGEARPIAPNDTPAGRQQNRRVEVVITR
jgi:outer membrane protein OmpA-like peptidoglycan-associated protein